MERVDSNPEKAFEAHWNGENEKTAIQHGDDAMSKGTDEHFPQESTYAVDHPSSSGFSPAEK